MEYELAELARKLNNLIRIGTIIEADYERARVRVKTGDIETDWLPWLTKRASNNRDWDAPEAGEQILLFSPSGDLAQAYVLPAIYQSDHPAPETSAEVTSTHFGDGAIMRYDRDNNHLTINLPESATIAINADGGITVNGDITVTGDVIANGISLTEHVHTGVKPGNALTGEPE